MSAIAISKCKSAVVEDWEPSTSEHLSNHEKIVTEKVNIFKILPRFLKQWINEVGLKPSDIDNLVFISENQDDFLLDLDAFNVGLQDCEIKASSPFALCVKPEKMIRVLLNNACRLIAVEKLESILFVLYNGESLVFCRIYTTVHQEQTPNGITLSALSRLSLATFVETVNGADKGINLILDKPQIGSFVRKGDILEIPEHLQFFINYIGLSKGEPQALEDLEDTIIKEDMKLTLSMLGVKNYRKSTKSRNQLCVEAVDACLSQIESSIEIDGVLLSSHSFPRYDEESLEIKAELETKGINSDIELLYMTRCSSAISSVRYAIGEIMAGDKQNILIVLVDKVINEQNGRTLNNGLSLFSDGACAFIVSQNKASFEVEELSEHTDHSMATVKPGQRFVDYLRAFGNGLKKVTQQMHTTSPEEKVMKHLITGNYNLSIMKNYSLLAGFKPNQVYTKKLQDHSHLFSSDLIMNMSEMERSGEFENGDEMMLLGTGSFHWGAMRVKYNKC